MTTCFLSPIGNEGTPFFIPGTTTLASGGQLFFYVAGSSTKQTVYKDNAAGTAWSNPIVLDSGGNLPSGGEIWFPQGQTFKIVFAPSNDTDPPASPYWSKDNVAGVNDASVTLSEWTAAPTPSFVSGTTFTMSGDQTAAGLADPGRRMKYTVTAGTVYGYIVGRSFGGGLTNVTTQLDSGALDSGLSAASYGLVSATHDSVPLLPGGRALFMDPTDATKRVALNLANVSTGVVRTYTVVDTSDTFVMVSAAATEFNKTFVDPVLNTSATGITGSGLATKATVTTNSGSLLMTPSSSAFHLGVVAAWAKADTAGNINGAYQILSVTDIGTGRIEFNLSSSAWMTNTNFNINYGIQTASTATVQSQYAFVDNLRPPTISTVCLVMLRSDGATPAPFDPNQWYISIFGLRA